MFDLFIKPFQIFFRFRADVDMDASELVRLFFHSDERKIFRAVTTERVTIRGSLADQPLKPKPGIVKKLPKGVTLWIRFDKKESQRVDVEFEYLERHKKDSPTKIYHFKLTPKEFQDIFKSIEIV